MSTIFIVAFIIIGGITFKYVLIDKSDGIYTSQKQEILLDMIGDISPGAGVDNLTLTTPVRMT